MWRLCNRQICRAQNGRRFSQRPSDRNNTLRAEGHAVVAARLDGHWLILDDRRIEMVEDVDITHYRPLFVIDQYDLRKYISSRHSG